MRVLLLTLLLCFTATVEAAAQHTTAHKAAPTAPAAAPGAKLTPASLHTDKLNYADDLERIYVGDFEHVGFKPDSNEFGMIVGGYMTQYSESCARYLPEDKVEIMTQECAQEAWTVNGYGVSSPDRGTACPTGPWGPDATPIPGSTRSRRSWMRTWPPACSATC